MGDCIHCNKPDCGIPPMYDKPMCMDCWVKHTPEGEAWLTEYEDCEVDDQEGGA